MISVLIIGLGRFGRHMAIKFQEQGNDVMAVEKDETRADEMAPVIQNIQIGDATNEDFLQSLGVGNYDVCVVGIGESFQTALEITVHLKDLGAKYVVARATRDIYKKLLLKEWGRSCGLRGAGGGGAAGCPLRNSPGESLIMWS